MNSEQIFNLPEFKKAQEVIRIELLKQLEEVKLDGQPQTTAYVLELVRLLQSRQEFVRLLSISIDHAKVDSKRLERELDRDLILKMVK